MIILIFVGGIYILNEPEWFLTNHTKTDTAKDETTDDGTGGNKGIIFVSSSSTNEVTLATTTEDVTDDEQKLTGNAIYTGKKEPGNILLIDFVYLEKTGFVVVYENTFEPTGELLGVSLKLSAGEHVKVPIRLSRKTKDGEVFTAMLHSDNGDGIFTIANDPPLRDEEENSFFTNIIIQSLSPEEREDASDKPKTE